MGLSSGPHSINATAVNTVGQKTSAKVQVQGAPAAPPTVPSPQPSSPTPEDPGEPLEGGGQWVGGCAVSPAASATPWWLLLGLGCLCLRRRRPLR